ncbi:MAG: formylglycine-generating enzyme family protein [bacterium]|nr:formylglycine-generating enzyme family protein [bacterium]
MVFDFLFGRKKEPEPGGEFIESVGQDLVPIKGGSFLMGSNDGEDDERPIHNVLVEDFMIGKYEVTQEQWFGVMGTKPWEGLKSVSPGDRRPVVNVDWYDARNFVRQLNKLSGLHYRLPTEAEWEYACRAGSASTFSHGPLKEGLSEYAWFYDNAFIKGDRQAHEVGELKPNKWGLYDMLGNVYEWCSDWYRRNHYNKSRVQNPKGAKYGNSKAVRGGDWARTDYFLRVASRRYYSPHYKDLNVGFRIARNAPPNNENNPLPFAGNEEPGE